VTLCELIESPLKVISGLVIFNVGLLCKLDIVEFAFSVVFAVMSGRVFFLFKNLGLLRIMYGITVGILFLAFFNPRAVSSLSLFDIFVLVRSNTGNMMIHHGMQKQLQMLSEKRNAKTIKMNKTKISKSDKEETARGLKNARNKIPTVIPYIIRSNPKFLNHVPCIASNQIRQNGWHFMLTSMSLRISVLIIRLFHFWFHQPIE
jgi:hypothetical protein